MMLYGEERLWTGDGSNSKMNILHPVMMKQFYLLMYKKIYGRKQWVMNRMYL